MAVFYYGFKEIEVSEVFGAMDEQSLQTIEFELAVFIRRVTSITSNKRIGSLDRSAYLLLNQISAHGSAGVKALAGEFNLDISTVSRQALALEQKGYVYKVPDPLDGRAFSFQLTELGTKELIDYKEARLAKINDLLKGWSDAECQTFGTLLSKFNRTAEGRKE